MEENVIQINGRIKINVDVSVKNVKYVKKVISRILIDVVVKMDNSQQVLWMIQQLYVMKFLESYDDRIIRRRKKNYFNKL